MALFDDNAQAATVNCTKGHAVPITIGQAKASATVRCPTCGQAITLKGDQFRSELEKVERMARDAFKDIKINIKL